MITIKQNYRLRRARDAGSRAGLCAVSGCRHPRSPSARRARVITDVVCIQYVQEWYVYRNFPHKESLESVLASSNKINRWN